MAERQPALVTPFWVRIATETNLSPGWLLIAFPAVLYPTYLLLEALFGRGLAAATDFAGDFDARILFAWVFGLGYVTMMATYVARRTFRDLGALRPVLEGGEAAYVELRKQLTQFDRRRLWIGSILLLAFLLLNAEFATDRWTRLATGDWSLRATCIVAACSAFAMIAGRVIVYLIDSSHLYSRMGENHVVVDLLDLSPLSPLTHHGLRIVLFIVIGTVVGLVVNLPPSTSVFGSPIAATLLTHALNVVMAAAAFLLPVRGLRRHIRARKEEELARIREDIRRNRELAAESAEAGGRLPGLIAYMNQIESVREWPFDASTLTRFFLYVAIPLGSWVGGALVERLLGAALD